MRKNRFFLIIFLLLFTGCLNERFSGTIQCEAELLGFQKNSALIKIKVGKTNIYDKLNLGRHLAILAEWKLKTIKTIPLSIKISGYSTSLYNDSCIIYFYKGNRIHQSNNVSYELIREIALANKKITWKIKNKKVQSIIKTGNEL